MNNKNKGLGVRILVLVAGLLAASAHGHDANGSTLFASDAEMID